MLTSDVLGKVQRVSYQSPAKEQIDKEQTLEELRAEATNMTPHFESCHYLCNPESVRSTPAVLNAHFHTAIYCCLHT